MVQFEDVLTFWFGDPNAADSEYGKRRKVWFSKNARFDQEIRDRFLSTYEDAIAGKLDDWQHSPQGSLALTIVLDQFPRNMFRGTLRAFEADEKAVAVAKEAIAQGYDRQLELIQRVFLYLPLEHSEDLGHQHQSVLLCQQVAAADSSLHDFLDYAIRHRDIIEKFGRFPHRNRILGRQSTSIEHEFLKQPGSSF
ncbi:MAG TPA: DUF924 family protein [Crinalium sp.]|jgi:uncharacterized protein (DUF924 family)